MQQFLGMAGYEFKMCIKRAGFWIVYGLLAAFYLVTIMAPGKSSAVDVIDASLIWQQAGQLVFTFNVFLPLLAGILAADRMQRDFRGGVRELQRSAPLSNARYILAKYVGVLGSVLLPVFIIIAMDGIMIVAGGHAPVGFLWPLFLAFLSITVPAHAFVVAFSLACPLVLPLRVYQVLFTGYWFWGNLLSPQAFPTISDTVLNAVGQFPLYAYFGGLRAPDTTAPYTPAQAILNLAVLSGMIALALIGINIYMRAQAKKA